MPVITKPIEAPSGLKVTIRKLSYWQVRNAKKAFISDAIAQGKEMGDLADRVAAAREKAGVQVVVDTTPPDPWSMYDQQLTLHFGITGWAYEEPVSDEHIDNLLDESDADYIFHEIVLYGDRSAEEKKESVLASERVSALATVAGPEN